MAGELGLLTPENPVTVYPNPAAAVAAVTGPAGVPGGPCGTGALLTAAPPELPPDRVQRLADYIKRHPIQYKTRFEATICSCTFFSKPPPPEAGAQPCGKYGPSDYLVNPATGRVYARLADGRVVESETPCLQGFGRGEYKTYLLDGTYLCSTYGGEHPPDPSLPAPSYPNPGTPFGRGVNVPGIGGVGRGPGGLGTIAGVNVGDVLNFLAGSGVKVDLSGVLYVLAALVAQGGNIRGSLDQLPPALRNALGPSLETFGGALDRLVPGVGGQLAAAIQGDGGVVPAVTQDMVARGLGAVPQAIPPAFQSLVDAAGSTLKGLVADYRHAAASISTRLLTLFREDLEGFGAVRPDNVHELAGRVLGTAITAGTTAQLAGFVLELLHPLKNLGIQQAIGVLTQFAGFGEITRPYLGATLRYGIQLPAEHRAAAHFRTQLPGDQVVRELAAAGLVPPEKYAQRLLYAGYPDPYPRAFLDHLHSALPPRALAAFTDGSEADRPWLAAKLRYSGVSKDDTARIVRALELKAAQPGRARLVGALLTAYKAGQLEHPDLEAGLAGAGLSDTHATYYLRAAELERRGDRMEAVAGEIANQYRNDVVSQDAARQLLTGLGFTADEIAVRLTVGELRRNLVQVKAEERALAAELRQLKAQGLKGALAQVRAGFLDPGLFLAVGQGMGYSRAYLDVALELEGLRGAPTSTPAAPAIGRGALVEIRDRMAQLVAQQVTARQTSRVAAVTSLRAVGLPDDLASELVLLADAIAGPDPIGGDYGIRAGGAAGLGFGAIAATVASGLAGLGKPEDLVLAALKALGLPLHDRAAVERVIRDLRDLFRGL